VTDDADRANDHRMSSTWCSIWQSKSPKPREKLVDWLSDGTAWRKFISLVYAQDGDASSLEKITEVHRALRSSIPWSRKAPDPVTKMDAEIMGQASRS
jgi:thymidine phosphorylase